MKKIIFGAVAAALICSCSGEKKTAENQSIEALLAERLENAKTFEDSVIAIQGTFVGAYFNFAIHQDPQFSEKFNMSDFERGIRQVMIADSTEMSYVYGLNIGMGILQAYTQTSSQMPLDKGKFMETVMSSLRLDSIDASQVQEMSMQYEQIANEIFTRKQQELEKEIYNTPEAEQNRTMAQSIASAFQSNSDFTQIENSGIYCNIEEEGTGDLLAPDERVKVNFTVLRLDGEPIDHQVERSMFPARGFNPMLTEVLKYMRHGQKAKFFIPYEYAYGVQGNPDAGVGPCESVYMTVEIL
ncbi:MAG: FKBP-type peptidyl-prolyl cis-trans isomerase [Muribaculaceae bacterium]|nr:FKBP-type peptidyl-prolyl cis-trans isomerase [Muribaculaceae bacterium]